jgi:hypothetical protein
MIAVHMWFWKEQNVIFFLAGPCFCL